MIVRKNVAKFAYSDSLQKDDIDLGNTEFLRKVDIEFNGTLTAAGGSADGSLKQDGLLRTALKSLIFTANGNDKFANTDGVGEYFRRAIMSGSPGVLVSTMPTGAASTSQRASQPGIGPQVRHRGRPRIRRCRTTPSVAPAAQAAGRPGAA